ncbi:EamA-like transporter family protein [Monaibacterium marinum]|uniref:EamA-like transporter family protein n=1 Tax=Pontivivens marinum TaxID=1690039 RepID=A0A2C9CSB3_9RHOB|nr:DMT family transporter [Monaibacterium marinum]SOH94147.1 EamA-like transporter family protein [Monaibacterium marinum]
MNRRAALGALLAIGVTWGMTVPAAKVAVSTGYQPFGLIFWQLLIATLLLGALMLRRGMWPPLHGWPIFVMVAVLGTIFPNSFSYRAAAELPAGVMSIVIAVVPMFALPVALALGLERLRLIRLVGLALGAVAIAMIAGPETSLPDPGAAPWLLVALIAPLCYAFEGNLLAKFGTRGLDPLSVLFGASVVGLIFATPLMLATDQWINPVTVWHAPEYAILASGILHVAAYSGYIWLVGWAGPVFAAQVAYLVTGSGVVWSMLLLGERYSPWVWAALLLMLVGVALVQPRGGARD